MKNLILALALVGFTLAGCAEEPAEPAEPIVNDAEVVTEPTDDILMEADTTMMEEGDVLGADTTATGVEAPVDTTAL